LVLGGRLEAGLLEQAALELLVPLQGVAGVVHVTLVVTVVTPKRLRLAFDVAGVAVVAASRHGAVERAEREVALRAPDAAVHRT
jgi:hypothetical protein